MAATNGILHEYNIFTFSFRGGGVFLNGDTEKNGKRLLFEPLLFSRFGDAISGNCFLLCLTCDMTLRLQRLQVLHERFPLTGLKNNLRNEASKHLSVLVLRCYSSTTAVEGFLFFFLRYDSKIKRWCFLNFLVFSLSLSLSNSCVKFYLLNVFS